MKPKHLLKTLVTSTIFVVALGIVVTPSANAAPCTKAEIKALQAVDFEMAMTSLSGDLTDLFAEISKSSKATKKKSLKDFYKKLESAVESDNGVLKTGPSRTMWRTLQTKYQYNRC
jgi:hypothetical protein